MKAFSSGFVVTAGLVVKGSGFEVATSGFEVATSGCDVVSTGAAVVKPGVTFEVVTPGVVDPITDEVTAKSLNC